GPPESRRDRAALARRVRRDDPRGEARDLRGRNLPGEPLAPARPPDPRDRRGRVREAADADAFELRRLPRRGRPPDPLREPGTISSSPRTAGRDAADQGDPSPSERRAERPRLGGGIARQR